MQTIANWAYNMYFGLPLVGWLGILTYIFLDCYRCRHGFNQKED